MYQTKSGISLPDSFIYCPSVLSHRITWNSFLNMHFESLLSKFNAFLYVRKYC